MPLTTANRLISAGILMVNFGILCDCIAWSRPFGLVTGAIYAVGVLLTTTGLRWIATTVINAKANTNA